MHSQVEHSSGTDPVLPSRSHQCLYCSRNHALEDCNALRWKPYAERTQFLASNKLCFGCLSNQHVSKFCPERKACKITNCTRKHPSILHTNFRERPTTDVNLRAAVTLKFAVTSHGKICNRCGFFLMKLYCNTDTLRTILVQVYYKKQKQKKLTLHTILLLAPLFIM